MAAGQPGAAVPDHERMQVCQHLGEGLPIPGDGPVDDLFDVTAGGGNTGGASDAGPGSAPLTARRDRSGLGLAGGLLLTAPG